MPDNDRSRREDKSPQMLPSNSHKSRTRNLGSETESTALVAKPKGIRRTESNLPPAKKTERVTTGKVIKRKRGASTKLKEAFFGEDTQNVKEYIIYDVLVQRAKEMFFKMLDEGLMGSVDMVLFGGKSRRNHTYRTGGRSYTSYGDYYRDDGRGGRSRDSVRDGRRELSRTGRSRHDFDEIVFNSRGEAEEVLSHMVDLIVDYGMVAVADFYELAGVSSSFADHDWGWNDLRDSSVSRVREGYLINLPKTQPLK